MFRTKLSTRQSPFKYSNIGNEIFFALKTKLTAKSLTQICGMNKVRAKPTFQN